MRGLKIRQCGVALIEMGELNEWSSCFYYASLELRSDSERIELMNRLAQFEITFVWS